MARGAERRSAWVTVECYDFGHLAPNGAAMKRTLPRGRRHYDVPSDHFTRYELDLMREHACRSLVLEVELGVSMAWGLPGWTRSVDRLPTRLAQATLGTLDRLARLLPGLSDVVVLAGRPRDIREASTISS